MSKDTGKPRDTQGQGDGLPQGLTSGSNRGSFLKRHLRDKGIIGPHRPDRIAEVKTTITNTRTDLQSRVNANSKDVKFFISSSGTSGPALERLIRNLDATIADIETKALENYGRVLFSPKKRSRRKDSKPTRVAGTTELSQLAHDTRKQLRELTDFFNEVKKESKEVKEERVITSLAKGFYYNRDKGSLLMVDLDNSMIDSAKGRAVGMVMPPDFVRNIPGWQEFNVQVATCTGRTNDLVVENFQLGGAESRVTDSVPKYGENGLWYRGPDTNGEDVPLDDRLPSLVPLSKDLQDTIKDRLEQDQELQTLTRERGASFIGLSPGKLGATVQGLKFNTDLKKHLLENISTEDTQATMDAVNRRAYAIADQVLKEKGSKYTDAFILDNTGEKGILIKVKPETGIVSSKGRAAADAVKRFKLRGFVVSVGDDHMDLEMPKTFQAFVDKGQLHSQVFIAVELAEGKTSTEVRDASDYMTREPDHSVAFFGKVLNKMRELKQQDEATQAGPSSKRTQEGPSSDVIAIERG